MISQINLIKIIGIKDQILNFRNVLSSNNSLIIKNCYNLKILIKTKINKITIENSNNIFVQVNKLINGFEVAYSKYVLISSNNQDFDTELNESIPIPIIDIYKSIIYLVGSIKLYSDIKVICVQSDLFQVEIE